VSSHSDFPDPIDATEEANEDDESVPPATTSDNWSKSADSPVPLLAIWGSGTNDVWAVGSKNTVLHWSGTTWTPTLSGTSGNLSGVWGSGSSDIWAVGGSGDSYEYGQSLRWNGATWTVSVSQSSCEFYGVWGTSSSDVWAVGSADAMTESCIYRCDGTAWKEHTGFATGPLKGIWGSAANDVWAVGGNISDNGVISHWDGSAWTVVAQGSELLELYGLTAVWGSSSSDVWAISSQNVAHWNGQAWAIEQCMGYAYSLAAGSTQPNCQEGNFAVWGNMANDVWVAGAIVNAEERGFALPPVIESPFNGALCPRLPT
jgi:hypothetical protein